jgi:hypothetical protein
MTCRTGCPSRSGPGRGWSPPERTRAAGAGGRPAHRSVRTSSGSSTAVASGPAVTR